MAVIRRFGSKPGGPGIVVNERSGINQIPDPTYGSTFMLGVLKRGPMGVIVPVRSKRQYNLIFGDPSDDTWHLFTDSSHLCPDAIDGFFSTGGGAGVLMVCRPELDKTARSAERVFLGRNGAEVLRIKASNEGRWGGAANKISGTPIIYATSRTFTLVTPGVERNEFRDADAKFSNLDNRIYKIVSNTKADPVSGETIYTVGAQYDLVRERVSGPVAMTGIATYSPFSALTGTIAYALYQPVTGTASINERVITGVGTLFTTELQVGANVYHNGEARAIESITSNTTLTVAEAFSVPTATNITLQRDNLIVTGTNTQFTTELATGDEIFVEINGVRQARVVGAIASPTELTLNSGFSDEVGAGTQASRRNFVLRGTGTNFLTEIKPGEFIVDPNRAGKTVKVVRIVSNTELRLEKPFQGNFADAQLTRQPFLATVEYKPAKYEGLAIEISQGLKKPDTHFTITVFFNGSQVLQVPDCSLDRNDPDFVNTKVANANIAHATGIRNYAQWIEAESLWSSTYTTSQQNDVRPCNGSGKIVHLTSNTMYTVADLDWNNLVGQRVYPNPYEFYRDFYTIQQASAPIDLQGTVSSAGVNVTGTATRFSSETKAGQYLYDPASGTARKVRSVLSDTRLVLDTPFPVNMVAGTRGKIAGTISVGERYDLRLATEVGNNLLVTYPQYLERGYDGDTGTLAPHYFTQYLDIDYNFIEKYTLNRNLGLVKIAVPGISDETIQKTGIYYAQQQAYQYRAEIPSYITSSSVAEAYVLNRLGRSDFEAVAFPSYGTIASPFSGSDRLIPLTGEILGGEARQAVTYSGYHYPFAGLRSVMPRVLRLPVGLDMDDEAVLNMAGIQPIKILDGNAIVYGARIPAESGVYDFKHIREIQSNYVRVFLEARNLLEMLFQPNQPGVLSEAILLFNEFARGEYRKGTITQYLSFQQAVSVTSDIRSDTAIAGSDAKSSLIAIINGKLNINFTYTPTGIVEVLNVTVGPDLLAESFGQSLASAA